jgi:hypothetical protein
MAVSSSSSSSMDDQEDSTVSPKCEEAWFDDIVADPCGKEFELPDISSTPILFSPNKLLDTTPAAALENAFVLDMNNLYSFAGNRHFSSPQITNSTVPMVNHQQGTFCSSRNSSVSFVPIVNQQVLHFPPPTNLLDLELAALKNQLVNVPISSGFSWNGLDMNFSLRNRRFHADNSTHPIDKSKFGSNIHNIPSKTSQFSSNNCIVHVPVMTNILANRESTESYSTDTEKGQHQLHHHRKRSAKTVSFRKQNQVESPSTPSPQIMRNYQQAFGASFHVARNNYNVKYACKECNKEFPSYSAFGGHMSFHARTRKKSI